MRNPVIDPASGVTFTPCVRKRFAAGFDACDNCEKLRFAVCQAKTMAEKMMKQRELTEHINDVKGSWGQGCHA